MKRNQLLQMAVPLATALFVAGCCSSSHKTASYGAQGAPAVAQTTEVITASSGIETNGQADIQLHKEEMVVGKREVSNGGVLIRTVVQSESVTQPVELRREEYMIERIPASEAAAKSLETAFQGKEIYIPLTREEPVTSTRALLTEKVQLGKKIETDRQTVSTPIRSEDVEIVKVSGKTTGTYLTGTAPAAPAAAGSANALNLMREEMIVGKTVVDNGGVKLAKVVRTQVASQPIELKREEFTIDRSPLTTPQVAGSDFTPKEIRLNLTREEPVIGTRIEPTELVRVRKQVYTDKETVSGTLRKENIEIVKLTPDQASMGGTSASGQSGATVISESGKAKEMSLQGTAVCGKCQLHQTETCQSVIQVKQGDKTLNYYLVENNVAKSFEGNRCKVSKNVTATGWVQEVAGKLQFTASKITLSE